MGSPGAKKTDLIRVDQRFADMLRKISQESGDSIINITSGINLSEKKKKRGTDVFALTRLD